MCKWDKGCNRGKYEITDDDMYAKAASGWGQPFLITGVMYPLS